MKAVPLFYCDGDYHPCKPEQASHVELNLPGSMPHRILPVIISGERRGTPCWTWNGDTERPTLKPSILTRFTRTRGGGEVAESEADLIDHVCHSFVTDGRVQFLGDCTHSLAGQTLDLLEVEGYENP